MDLGTHSTTPPAGAVVEKPLNNRPSFLGMKFLLRCWPVLCFEFGSSIPKHTEMAVLLKKLCNLIFKFGTKHLADQSGCPAERFVIALC
jgi:hypothetical protein